MAQGDDEDDEAIAKLIAQSFADAMPEIRANNDRLRREIGAFFGVAVEQLPAPQTLGWHRMLATFVYGYKKADLPGAAEDLRHALEGHLYRDERPS